MTPLQTATPRCVWDVRAALGEGPVWAGEALWFLDIKGAALHRYDPVSGDSKTWSRPEGEYLSCLAPAKDGRFIAATRNGFAWLDIDAASDEARLHAIHDPEPDAPDNRFNDGKAAPDGSFWAGTMDDAEKDATGAWWRLDASGAAERVDEGYRVTNGPAFDAARGRVYLTDSARRRVYVGTSDGARLGPKTVWREFDEIHGYPDGMTVDSDGGVWIAFWDGGCVRRLSPEGDIVQEIALPVPRPTSVCFGGEDLDKLFVTSARVGLAEAALDAAPSSGGLFSIEISRSIGLPPHAYC